MTNTRTPVTALVILVASALAGAQNAEMQHRDGTTTGGSRGGINTAPVGLYQRFPADQTCGAATIHEFNILLQDQNASTLENVTLVLRRNLAGGPATGSPDISAAGVIGGTIFNGLSFGTGPAPAAAFVQVIFPGAGPTLPAGGVPAGDVYVGAELPATTGANANFPLDGLSAIMNATAGFDLGEQYRSNFVGYTGLAGVMGLGWVADLTNGFSLLGGGDRSWAIGLRPAQDVLQPFVANAAVFVGNPTSGLNPNFGYVGIAPDVLRGDAVGFRLRSNAPAGSLVVLGFDVAAGPPTFVGVDGLLCLNLATATLLPTTFNTFLNGTQLPVPPSHLSELLIGPFPGLQAFNGFGNIVVQVGTLDSTAAGGIRLSTMARVNF